MKNIFQKTLILLLCFCAGCAWIQGKEKSAGIPVADREALPTDFVAQGKVVNSQALGQGGRLLIVPFKAGAGVEANEELSRAALMIVKGVADVLQEKDSSFEILSGGNASTADFILQGHVIRQKTPSRLGRWILRDRKIRMEVEGRLFNARSRETVLLFTHLREGVTAGGDAKELGYAIGEDLGRFILSAKP